MRESAPKEFTPGESLVWQKCFTDYPAGDGWALVYSFRGSGPGFNVSATADGDSFGVSVAPNVTGNCTAGKYYFQAFVEKDSEKYLVDSGETTVLPSLASADAGEAFDGRSQVKRILDAIDAMVLGKASLDQMEYTIGNRQLKRIPIGELITLRDKYQSLYNQQLSAARIKNGGGYFKTIPVRFRQPR